MGSFLRRHIFAMVAALLGVALALGGAEVLLQAVGVGPWKPFAGFGDLPSMTLPHDTLGWVNRPGRYVYAPIADTPETINVTIDPSGARATSAGVPASHSVWMAGGSFIFGFGVDDDQTLPSALARLRPDLQIENYAVPGYGTVQSRGLFSEVLGDGIGPKTVIYGLVDYHDARNVAAPSWLYGLDQAAGPNPWVKVPSVEWDGKTLKTVAPKGYRHWPMSERWSVIYLFERGVVALRDWGTEGKTEVTVQVIKAWQGEIESAGAELLVALLHAPEAGDVYRERLAEEGVRFVDLVNARYPGPGFSLPGDGHPTPLVYEGWAETLAGFIHSTSR